MNRIHVVSRLRAQRQLIAADAPRRACRRPEGIKAASDRFAIRFVITSGAGAPTGLSSVVPNAAARRIVVATTVAATAALAPSRYSTSGPPGRQYLLGTARSCSCTAYDIPLVVTTALNARQSQTSANSAASWAVKSASGSRSFFRLSEPYRSSSAFRSVARDRRPLELSLVEKRSSCGIVRAPCTWRDEGVKTRHDSTARNVQEAWFITNRRRRDSASPSGSACSLLTIGRLTINRTVTAARAVSGASVPRRRA